MVNFHGDTHGGMIFSHGDMAFAAVSNSHGQKTLAQTVAISFLKATKPGDRLVAEATEQRATGPIALYDITVRNERTGDLVAEKQDLVYREKEWFALPADRLEGSEHLCFHGFWRMI